MGAVETMGKVSKIKAACLTAATAAIPSSVWAAEQTQAVMKYQPGQIMEAVRPIILILQEVAEPVAYGMMLWGLIKVIMGQQADGLNVIKTAGWGFVFVRLLPWFFGIIKGIGAAAPY